MNTHDIDLPDLPEHFDIFTDRTHSEIRAYALAAIKADRKTYNPIGEGTIQQLHDVLLYLQNETMKLEAAYGSNFKKEATEKARAATEKMKEAVYAINKSARKRRGEPVAWKIIKRVHNSDPVFTVADPTDVLMSKYIPLYTAPQPAEPVKVPSDDQWQTLIGWLDRRRHYPTVQITGEVAGDIADLLARYGSATDEAAKQQREIAESMRRGARLTDHRFKL